MKLNCCALTARRRTRRGAMLVVIAFMLAGFMIAISASVNTAWQQRCKSELQIATDAASRAATVTLIETGDVHAAVQRGQQIAAANLVDGEPLRLRANDFAFGRSQRNDSGKFTFVAGDTDVNSVWTQGRHVTEDTRHGRYSSRLPWFSKVPLQTKCSATTLSLEDGRMFHIKRTLSSAPLN